MTHTSGSALSISSMVSSENSPQIKYKLGRGGLGGWGDHGKIGGPGNGGGICKYESSKINKNVKKRKKYKLGEKKKPLL